ncbi:AAA family ATPase [Silicimonas sp. MF1-12-2]|uniref:AAA family ATPase n=1 Tax=Silicimonas sp. MF1-12-2 TaxID=3384793 RepID=UPI0039B6D263
MRLRRLDLTRFGHFTDFSLDFGPREAGKPDLHIIFGPNEAGKTTAFEGYLDLLFGIPGRSKYNFLHDYEYMRVGAVLEIDDEPIELVRIKRNKGDLITPSGESANPARLLHALDGIDRDQYRAMFSLDDETIEAGGEDILASQGNLGELLFSAAAGLSDLGSVLEAARAEVGRFHKHRARKTELADAKRDLQELHTQIREIDVQASTFRHLKEDRDAAAKLLTEAKEARDTLLERQARLKAMIECLPLLTSLRELNGALEDYAKYPSLPDGVQDETQDLKTKRVEAATRLRQSTLLLEGEQKARDALILDPKVAEIADELTVLLDAPRSRAQTAEGDLPKRETELETLWAELSGFAQELGVDTPEDGLLAEARLAQFEAIASDHADAKSKLATAEKEEVKANERLEGLTASAKSEKDPSTPTSDLATLIEALEPEDRLSRYENASADLEAAEALLKRALEALHPWFGASGEVAGLSFTTEEAARVAEHWEDLHEQRATAARESKEAQRQYDEVAARLAEFAKDEAAAVDDEAKEVREERDALWSAHLEGLTLDTAERFHASLMRDDALQEARLGFAERLARLRELQLDAAAKKATLTSCKEAQASLESLLASETEQLHQRLVAIGLSDTYDPRDLPAWQSRLSLAQEKVSELADKKKRHENAARSVDEAIVRLREAMAISEDDISLKNLTRAARAAAAEAANEKAKAEADRKRLEEAEAEAAHRTEEVKRLRGELTNLAETWAKEVTDLPSSLQSLNEFRWKLPTLRKLASKLAERDALRRRIEAMEKDHGRFKTEIEALARQAGEDIDAAPLVLGERLRRRLERANKSNADLETLNTKIADTERDVRAAEADLGVIDGRVDELARTFGDAHDIQSIDDLIEAMSSAAKAEQLRRQSEELRERVVTRLGVSNIAEAEDLLADQDLLELQGQEAAVATDLQAAEEEHEDKIGDLRAARDALEKIGGDDAAARLEEQRQTLLLDLEDRARAALRLKLGILAAEQALAAYRDEHRSNMLADTEVAFSKLTGGRYQDLRTQADGQREILLALRRGDNRSITVSDMSKGTRFQLYLALRLAGYRQYASGGTTLPFVADDIMETFDNTRTAAALGLLREISEQGQALYFTHHEHVVELARETCGGYATIHALLDGARP